LFSRADCGDGFAINRYGALLENRSVSGFAPPSCA
jgi:hypothetical protein